MIKCQTSGSRSDITMTSTFATRLTGPIAPDPQSDGTRGAIVHYVRLPPPMTDVDRDRIARAEAKRARRGRR